MKGIILGRFFPVTCRDNLYLLGKKAKAKNDLQQFSRTIDTVEFEKVRVHLREYFDAHYKLVTETTKIGPIGSTISPMLPSIVQTIKDTGYIDQLTGHRHGKWKRIKTFASLTMLYGMRNIEMNYDKGQLHGKYIVTLERGCKVRTYKHGKRDGMYTYHMDNILHRIPYRDGLKHGKTIENEWDNRITQTWVNGQMHGLYTYYYKGKLRQRGYYKDGLKHGCWKKYIKDTDILSTESYYDKGLCYSYTQYGKNGLPLEQLGRHISGKYYIFTKYWALNWSIFKDIPQYQHAQADYYGNDTNLIKATDRVRALWKVLDPANVKINSEYIEYDHDGITPLIHRSYDADGKMTSGKNLIFDN